MSQNLSQVSNVASSTDVVESFFGVYLLYSLNPKYKGRTYIGFTVDPNRRINQHNKGTKSGGARRTSNRGPWEMVLIVHGFPNDISALRFEWAWQHPKRSRRLRNISRKKARETHFQHQLRIMLEMLRMGPWNKLPLTVRWLAEQFHQEFQADLCPPMHMPVTMGPVSIKKADSESCEDVHTTRSADPRWCKLCLRAVPSEDAISCVRPGCPCVTHIICLAKHFIGNNSDDLLPVDGFCPLCNMHTLWGDLIRKKKGCFKSISESPRSTDLL